jgi:hypothetical protein
MQAFLEHEDTAGIRGEITIREYPAGTLARVTKLREQGRIKTANALLEQGRVASVTSNLIMQATNVGKDLIIQRLIGVNTYSLNLAWGEIGTGSTTPAITDVALTTPVARTAMAAGISVDIGNNQAQIQYFFPDAALTNSTYTEFGTFVDGSATLSTGQLFNHALFAAPYTKAAGTDITVQVTITLT